MSKKKKVVGNRYICIKTIDGDKITKYAMNVYEEANKLRDISKILQDEELKDKLNHIAWSLSDDYYRIVHEL